jgi:hypothetical protein
LTLPLQQISGYAPNYNPFFNYLKENPEVSRIKVVIDAKDGDIRNLEGNNYILYHFHGISTSLYPNAESILNTLDYQSIQNDLKLKNADSPQPLHPIRLVTPEEAFFLENNFKPGSYIYFYYDKLAEIPSYKIIDKPTAAAVFVNEYADFASLWSELQYRQFTDSHWYADESEFQRFDMDIDKVMPDDFSAKSYTLTRIPYLT